MMKDGHDKENDFINRRRMFKKSLNPSHIQSFYRKKGSIVGTDEEYKKCTGVKEFCQTLSTNMTGKWARPQSKRASRKQSNRPETSTPMISTEKLFSKPSFLPPSSSKSMHSVLHEPPKNKKNLTDQFLDIEIIVNTKKPSKKQKSMYQEKFKTELPEEFLALFAD